MHDYAKAFRLDGKVALVSGAARGIGAEICRALAQSGAMVVVADILEEAGAAVAKSIRAEGGRAEFMRQDVTDEAQWEAVIARTVKSHGGLDVLVNNAGIEKMQALADVPIEDFRKILDVNMSGVFLGCKHAIRAMRPGGSAGRGGSIINLSSIAGLTGIIALGAYSAAKGGVRAFTKSIAVECGQLQYGIRCNSIHPGLVDTDMGRHFLNNFVDLKLVPDHAAAEAAMKVAHPIGHFGEPTDIASAALYLASDAARWVTGAEFVIDGGYNAI